MKRKWKRLPTRWKKRAGAARTPPKCWESATKRCFTRCVSSIWIRRGRGSPRRQGLTKPQPWERGTPSTLKRQGSADKSKLGKKEIHILRRDIWVILCRARTQHILEPS